jgi:hypothetical protein
MVVGTNQPVTFINSDINGPFSEKVKGTDLSLIRTHCATLQHRRRRSILKGKQVAYTSNDARRESQNDPSFDHHNELSNHGFYYPHEPPIALRCGHDSRRPGPPRRQSSSPTRETATSDERCPTCVFELARATALSINYLVPFDGHRNDPFDALPVPADAETFISIDYCETTASLIMLSRPSLVLITCRHTIMGPEV